MNSTKSTGTKQVTLRQVTRLRVAAINLAASLRLKTLSRPLRKAKATHRVVTQATP